MKKKDFYNLIIEELPFLQEKDGGKGELGYFKDNFSRYINTLNIFEKYSIRYSKKHDGKFKILDVGIYPGHLALALKKQYNHQIYGFSLEYSKSFLNKIKKEDISIKKINVISDSFPYHDESFDFIFCNEILEHLDKPLNMLSEMNRVLKSGGYLILSTPNIACFANRIKFLFGKSVFPPLDGPAPFFSNNEWRHFREYTVKEVRYLLEDNGFEVKEASFVLRNVQSDDRKKVLSYIKWGVKWILGKLIKGFREIIIIVATKK